MGSMLPKPVESSVIERHVGRGFRVGVAEMNGWRNNMEDSHLIHIENDWAMYGVFDGHGGDQCSAFVADKLHHHLAMHGCPQDDAAVKKTLLGIDKEFLDSGQDSGSTGTMCIVHKPTSSGGKFKLRVANVGDSRVLLGRRDGSIVKGSGTDGGLTIDHKPDEPSERERIYRCGGHVATGQMGGPARVNGELSVSRCFGDAKHKETGGPGPEDHPVTADPEHHHHECNEADFLLLVCDGISEGDFPNAAVVKLVASRLARSDDAGAAAQAVCQKAIEAGSKDNVTCMLVLLNEKVASTDKVEKSAEFMPGQLSSPTNQAFMTAYEGMAKRGGLTLAQAVEMRYEMVSDALSRSGVTLAKAKEMRAETDAIGNPAGPKGSSDRSAWFRNWEKRLPENMISDDSENELMRYMIARQGLAPPGAGGGGGIVGLPKAATTNGRRVRVADLVTLRGAVNESQVLKWDARMSQLAGEMGQVQEDDPSDGTSHVFCEAANMTAWLPTATLSDYSEVSAKPRTTPPGSNQRGKPLPPTIPTPARSDQLPWQGSGTDPSSRHKAGGGGTPSPMSTPNSSTSLMSASGARLITGPRLPTMSATTGGPSEQGYRAASPGSAGSAAGMRSNGFRSTGGRHRVPSPIDSSVGNRLRAHGPAGRSSRSVPPRPPLCN